MDKIPIRVDNRIRIYKSDVPDEIITELIYKFSHSNPVYYKLKAMNFSPWKAKQPKIIKTYHENDHQFSIPRGGLQILRDILTESDLPWSISDERSEGFKSNVLDLINENDEKLIPDHKIDLWDHQKRIVEAVISKENCVVRSSTGSGKTTAMLAAISRIQLPTIIIVWSTALMNQWLDRIETEFGVSRSKIGIIGGGSKKLSIVTVAMQQTLNNFTSSEWDMYMNVFGFVCCDEVQKFAASTFYKSVDRFNSRYRVGVSADHTRKDGKEFLISDIFGKVAIDVDKTELVGKGLIHDVSVQFIETEHSAPWYISMIAGERVPDFNRLLDGMIKNSERNDLILELICSLVNRKRRVMVFSHRVEHCKLLNKLVYDTGIHSNLMIGGKEWADTFEDTKNGISDGRYDVAIGTYSGTGVGIDLPNVDCGVIATPITNNKQFIGQVSGRLSRTAKDKTSADLYVIWDKKVHGISVFNRYGKWFNDVKISKMEEL